MFTVHHVALQPQGTIHTFIRLQLSLQLQITDVSLVFVAMSLLQGFFTLSLCYNIHATATAKLTAKATATATAKPNPKPNPKPKPNPIPTV